MSGPVTRPLKAKESDNSVSVYPCTDLSFNAADFTVAATGQQATISIDATGAGATLTDTYVGFGNASDLMTGSADFTFTADAGSGPVLLLTGETPKIDIQDDTGPTDYKTRLVQSGLSLYMFSQDSAGTDVELVRMQPGSVVFNDDGENLDFKIEGQNDDDLFYLDASQDNIGIGAVPGTEANRLYIAADGQFDPTTSTKADQNNTIYLYNSGGTQGDGAYGAAIAFGGVDSSRRRAAIAAVQTTSDADEVGLGFFTHDPASPASNEVLSEHMRLDDNGRLFISASDIGTDTAGARLHVRSLAVEPTPIVKITAVEDTKTDAGPILDLYRDGANPQDDDEVGMITFSGNDSGGNEDVYAYIKARLEDVTATTENAGFTFRVMEAGSLRQHLILGSRDIIFNKDGRDVNFRVETDGEPNMLYLQGEYDRAGIGMVPVENEAQLQVAEDATFNTYVIPKNEATSLLTGAEVKNTLVTVDYNTGASTPTISSGTAGECVTILNLNATQTVTVTAGVGITFASTPAVLNQWESEKWVCYKSNNWVRVANES